MLRLPRKGSSVALDKYCRVHCPILASDQHSLGCSLFQGLLPAPQPRTPFSVNLSSLGEMLDVLEEVQTSPRRATGTPRNSNHQAALCHKQVPGTQGPGGAYCAETRPQEAERRPLVAISGVAAENSNTFYTWLWLSVHDLEQSKRKSGE